MKIKDTVNYSLYSFLQQRSWDLSLHCGQIRHFRLEFYRRIYNAGKKQINFILMHVGEKSYNEHQTIFILNCFSLQLVLASGSSV